MGETEQVPLTICWQEVPCLEWTGFRNDRGYGRAKLTAAEVAQIRALLEQGVTEAAVAVRFGISQSHVSGIKTGRFWNG